MQKTPVILTFFGNSQGTAEVRNYLEHRFRKEFSNCEFYWAQSSGYFQKLEGFSGTPSPQILLQQLRETGHQTALIQSLHIAPAAEYQKLVLLCDQAPMQVRVSPPLLSSKEDCRNAASALKEMEELPKDVAAFLVLHGSSHEGGKFFHMMGETFMEVWGKQAFYGLLEGDIPRDFWVKRMKAAGFSKIFLLPFMLASRYHLKNDVTGEKKSWKSFFEKQNFHVTIQDKGIGLHPGIVSIFLNHLKKTLDTIA